MSRQRITQRIAEAMTDTQQQQSTRHEPTVLLGVTGCIAAYKACELLRLLQKAGARVKVVMTPMGAQFVTPATFRALTGEEVALAPVDDPSAPIHHISLAQEADVFLIAPATANTINKLANGVADNLLTTAALATKAPLLIAPAMNVHMWRDETTQDSLARLRGRGAVIIEPEAGYLACGEIGEGRLAPVEKIAEWTFGELRRSRGLKGRRILVTAGATREHVDPIRFLSNPSSGMTGYAIAEEAARRKAAVTLISGPTTLPDPFDCTVLRVTSASDMLDATSRVFKGWHVEDEPSRDQLPADQPFTNETPKRQPFDAAIFTAAVADYRPLERRVHKLKKSEQGDEMLMRLVANPDILATLAKDKGSTLIVGFAAETQDVIAAAKRKLKEKRADLIVANDVSDSGLGFATTHNRWYFVTETSVETTDILHKRSLACLLLDTLERMF
jgi:phosphopantothenoylcysteine decarboxylase/phosphopantothenate--cysteine ligase